MGGATLTVTEYLLAGQYIQSPNGQYRLLVTDSGDVELTDVSTGSTILDLHTAAAAPELIMQDDCNLVLYPLACGVRLGCAMYATGTNGEGSNCSLRLQDDRSLAIYSSATQVVYSFNTRVQSSSSSSSSSTSYTSSIGSSSSPSLTGGQGSSSPFSSSLSSTGGPTSSCLIINTYGDLNLADFPYPSTSSSYGTATLLYLTLLNLPALSTSAAAMQKISALQIYLDSNSNTLNLTLAVYSYVTGHFQGSYDLIVVSESQVLVAPTAGIYTFPISPSYPTTQLNSSLTYVMGVRSASGNIFAHYEEVLQSSQGVTTSADPFPTVFTPTLQGVQFAMAMQTCAEKTSVSSSSATSSFLSLPPASSMTGVVSSTVLPSSSSSLYLASTCTVYGDLELSSYSFAPTPTALGTADYVYLRNIQMPVLPAQAAAEQTVRELQILLDDNALSFNLTLALYAVPADVATAASTASLQLLTVSETLELVAPAAGVYSFNVVLPVVLNTSLSYSIGARSIGNNFYAHFVLEGLSASLTTNDDPFPATFSPAFDGAQFPMTMVVCSSPAAAQALGSPIIAGTRGISPMDDCIDDTGISPLPSCVTTSDTSSGWGNVLNLAVLPSSNVSYFATTIAFPMGYYGNLALQSSATARVGVFQLGASGWTLVSEGVDLLQYSFAPELYFGTRQVRQTILQQVVLVEPDDVMAVGYVCGFPCYETFSSHTPGGNCAFGISNPDNELIADIITSPITTTSCAQPDIWLLGNTVSPAAALVSSSSSSSAAQPSPSSSSLSLSSPDVFTSVSTASSSVASSPSSSSSTVASCSQSVTITVFAINGSSAFGSTDTPTGLFVLPGDIVTYTSNSDDSSWCDYPGACCDAAGLFNVGIGNSPSHYAMALAFRYGNTSQDPTPSINDFVDVFANLAIPVSPQSSSYMVPPNVPDMSQIWLSCLDTGPSDNSGSVSVTVITTSPAVCSSPSSSSGGSGGVGSSSTGGPLMTSSLPESTAQLSTSSFSSPTATIGSGCGSQLYEPIAVNAATNDAQAMYYLWYFSYGAQAGYGDVTAGITILPGGGLLQFFDESDSMTSQWCWTGGSCNGPQGSTSTLSQIGTPSAGWPGVTGSYPISSLVYRIAAEYANSSTSLMEYFPVFNSSTVLNRTIVLPASTSAQQLYLADLDWYPADDSGTVHVSVLYTPSELACASLLSSSSSTGAGSLPTSSFASMSSSSLPGSFLNVTSGFSALVPAPFGGRVGAAFVQQSLFTNAYLPYLFLVGGSNGGELALTDAVWQSTDGGVTWTALGTNVTLLDIPTLLGVGVALLENGVFALYGGVLNNGTAVSSVATTSTLFATAPYLYTAPFIPRCYHAYTTIPGTNITVFCAGLTSNGSSEAQTQLTNDCWMADQPELGPSSWTQLTAAAPFPPSLANAALVTLYDNTSTLLLCGGAVYAVSADGVYSSEGVAVAQCWRSTTLGATWTAAIDAPWAARTQLDIVSDLQGYAYLYGGFSTDTQQYLYDGWVTLDKANTWYPIQFANIVDVQDGCLVLYYTQTLYNGVFGTYPQLTIYSGYSSEGGFGGGVGYSDGSYFAPVSFSSSPPMFIPPIPSFPLSVTIARSECQVSLNIAGSLTGFGVSGLSPNPLLTASYIASLAAAILGIPANAVEVCIHVTYISMTQYGNSHHCNIYIVTTTTVNETAPLIGNITSGNFTRAFNATLSSTPTVAPLTATTSSSSSTGASLLSYSSANTLPPSSGSSGGQTGTVSGDPQFMGLRGQSYQIHGIDGEVYSLVRDDTGARINARFVFLTSGRCPPTDMIDTACWSHPGSYLGEVGVLSAGGVQLSIASGAATKGFSSVMLNAAPLTVGANVTTGDLSVYYTSSHSISINVGNYILTLHNSDAFVNLAALSVHDWSQLSRQRCHGLLGQTWRAPSTTTRGRQVREVEGEVDDYAEADSEILGDKFAFVREAAQS